MSETPTGRLCWHELLTTNPEGAPSFYGAIAGWGTQAIDGGAPPNWLVHISTPDLKATVAKALELGATIVD